MLEFFLELFSEEIPARMQRDAAQELGRICAAAFAELSPQESRVFYGPRRIAIAMRIAAEKPGGVMEARGPRDSAPDAALAGFLGKYGASRAELVKEGGYYWLRRAEAPVAAADLIARVLAPALAKFSWPKSMHWGQSDGFTWVRPLRRIVCLLDGAVVPISLGPITAGNETEGHRVLAPGAFAVSSALDWQEKLRAHYVIADQDERMRLFETQAATLLSAHGLQLVQDAQLAAEVAGLVEWPVTLLGRIDAPFMELPPEVRELSMKINQKYFALRDAHGAPAPFFAFVANLEAPDGGAAIVAGNERVLRARLSDARHFWDIDLKTPLDALLPRLEKITFHAKIGTQRARAERISALAGIIAEALGADMHAVQQARLAGLLCKADLVTGMVGEFPELQGVMGGYYAERRPNGWDGALIGPAIKTHYQPKGPSDAVPSGTVPVALALADKLDTLVRFFEIGEKPSGSGDPYALRRAALGVIRIILENRLVLRLRTLVQDEDLLSFIIERLRVKLRNEGQRFDVLDAVLGADGEDDDLVRIMDRVTAVSAFLATPDGGNLLIAYRRAANILRIEDAKDGPHGSDPVNGQLPLPEEEEFRDMLAQVQHSTVAHFREGDFAVAMAELSKLREVVDVFFERVTVNDQEPQNRLNRLRLLARLRDLMHQIADFSKIEG
jgi:glycyl-tRNA synthetase beta chain